MKDIIGWEGKYQITNDGRIWSPPKIPQNPTGRFIKVSVDHNGYPKVCLKSGNKGNRKSSNYSIHRLIAISFIPNPQHLPEVNHKNGIKSDNRLENLEWCSKRENSLHAFRLGLRKSIRGDKHKNSKLTDKEAFEIKYKEKGTQLELSKKYKVSLATIHLIKNNKRYSHI